MSKKDKKNEKDQSGDLVWKHTYQRDWNIVLNDEVIDLNEQARKLDERIIKIFGTSKVYVIDKCDKCINYLCVCKSGTFISDAIKLADNYDKIGVGYTIGNLGYDLGYSNVYIMGPTIVFKR